MTDKVSFDSAAPAGTINFGIGQPSPDLLPVELVRDAGNLFFDRAEPNDLNYGVKAGDPRFLDALSRFLAQGYGAEVDAESLFLTGGNSQALDLVSCLFARPGDTIFVEEPTYFLAFEIFRDHGLNIVSVPLDEEGLDLHALRRQLQEHRPAFLYTIPSYHNPGGQCLSGARRDELVALSREHGFLIVADEVYQLLYYGEPPPPALGTMIGSETVLSLGSFSKILAPGLRLGWIQTCPALRERLLGSGFVSSGGSINHFASHVARAAMGNGSLDAHVEKLRHAYRSRVAVMDEALQEHFAGRARWRRPDGGYFFWLSFDESVDTGPLRKRAAQFQAGFQPGKVFSTEGRLRNCMRLSFAHYREDDIREGIRRLRRLFD
ncbi:MAG: PLP-dependent aminotransferase family protein [Xanthomonadales bacterium]|nr:PLP-dependent aminotransferase family protein [Xanthomonadales bacterium]